MDILAAINIANEALKTVKTLKDIDHSLDKAELKSNMAELYSQLADVKIALTDAREEIQNKVGENSDLKKAMDFKETLVEVDGWKYRVNESGQAFGYPFCPSCETKERQFFQLVNTTGTVSDVQCPNCKFKFGRAAKRKAQ